MSGVKKTALLKQVDGWESSLPIRGVLRISPLEKALSLSVLNLEKRLNGEYYLIFGESLFKIDSLSGQDFLGVNIVGENATAGIVFYDGKTVIPVAIGGFSSLSTTENEVLINAKKHFKNQDAQAEERTVFQKEEYDDEAISAVNYYEFENDYAKGEPNGINELNCNKDVDDGKKEPREEEEEGTCGKEESFSACNGKREQETGNYYRKIKFEFESVLKEYPKEESLCKMVEDSEWVKIGEEDKYYTVGVIKQNGEAKYICYGLPSVKTLKPEGAKDFSHFIPISPFNLKGEGYWVTCICAKDGKCVK